jgi:hypothetical protein
MDKFKDYTIVDLLKGLELYSRLSQARRCFNLSSNDFEKAIDERKAEILRRCSLGVK